MILFKKYHKYLHAHINKCSGEHKIPLSQGVLCSNTYLLLTIKTICKHLLQLLTRKFVRISLFFSLEKLFLGGLAYKTHGRISAKQVKTH